MVFVETVAGYAVRQLHRAGAPHWIQSPGRSGYRQQRKWELMIASSEYPALPLQGPQWLVLSLVYSKRDHSPARPQAWLWFNPGTHIKKLLMLNSVRRKGITKLISMNTPIGKL
jgi:hypothetical protein